MLRLELRLAYAACPACVSACEAVNHRDSMVSFQNLKPSSAQRLCVFAWQGLQALQQSDVRHLAQKHGHTSDQSYTAWVNLYRSQLTYKKLCECLILPSNVHVYICGFVLWDWIFYLFPQCHLTHTLHKRFLPTPARWTAVYDSLSNGKRHVTVIRTSWLPASMHTDHESHDCHMMRIMWW